MSAWIDVLGGHRVQVLADGGLLWEHPCPLTYRNGMHGGRHQVSSRDGHRWTVEQAEPLTLSPSLHCDPSSGGCGMHGHVRDGRWV